MPVRRCPYELEVERARRARLEAGLPLFHLRAPSKKAKARAALKAKAGSPPPLPPAIAKAAEEFTAHLCPWPPSAQLWVQQGRLMSPRAGRVVDILDTPHGLYLVVKITKGANTVRVRPSQCSTPAAHHAALAAAKAALAAATATPPSSEPTAPPEMTP